MQLLVLLEDDGPSVVKSSVKGIGSTKPTLAPKGAVSAIESHSEMSDIESGPVNAMYPFSIRHLGSAETYILYAPTSHNRREWCDKIGEALEPYASALASRNANPFCLKVLSNSFRTQQEQRILKTRKHPTGRVKGTPLDRALEEEPQTEPVDYYNADTSILCADTYTHNGSQILVVGTGKGIHTLGEAADKRPTISEVLKRAKLAMQVNSTWVKRWTLVRCNNKVIQSQS